MTTRQLPERDFEAALLTAQSDLAARSHGEAETWVLPNANVQLNNPVLIGAADRHLTLRGGGPESVITLSAAAQFAITGARVALEGFAIDAAAAPLETCLTAQATLSLRLKNLQISGGTASMAGQTGIALEAPDIGVDTVDILNIRPAAGPARGLMLGGVGRARITDLAIARLSGDDVIGLASDTISSLSGDRITVGDLSAAGLATGLSLSAAQATLSQVTVTDISAGGPASGVELRLREAARLEDVAVLGLRGAGAEGTAFDDLSGDGARGLLLESPAGSAHGLRVSDLNADAGRAVAMRLPDGFAATALSIGQTLDGADLAATLAAAQIALADSPEGSTAEWTLPVGTFVLTAGLTFGQPGRGLILRGAPSADGGTTLQFRAGGGGAIAGDVDALRLSGTTLDLSELRIDARATGNLQAIVAAAETTLHLADVTLVDPRGGNVTALNITNATDAALNDVQIAGGRAAAGDFLGMAVQAGTVSASGLSATGLTASGRAQAVDILANAGIHLAATRISDLSGETVMGLGARVAQGVPGVLSVIDLRINDLDGAATGDDSIGAALICDGDIELRALGLRTLHASRAIGALIAATGTIDLLAAEISDVLGRTGGAAGIRVIGAPLAARDDGQPGIALRDITLQAVRGAATAGQGQPANSWLLAATELARQLVDTGLTALPQTGDPGHIDEIVGLAVTAPVPIATPWLGDEDPASLVIESGIFHRISGTVLQLDAALRDIGLKGCEAWTGVDAGWIDGERVTITNMTCHRMHRGIDARQSAVTAINSLITEVANGPGLFVNDGGGIAGGASFTTLGSAPLAPAPDPLPYVDAGPASDVPPSVVAGALAPAADIDLSLVPDAGLHAQAIPLPGAAADQAVYIGAIPPLEGGCCTFVDPDPLPAPAAPPPLEASPFTDYLGRDARAFMTAMMARADVVMPEWTTRSAADVTTMLLELLASEIDLRAYRQEEAVANAYLSTATQRRALEDHARLVDHAVDPGASAVAMLHFTLTDAAALGLAPGDMIDIPARTLVVNPDADDIALVFATETTLRLDPDLDALALVDGTAISKDGLSAQIAGDFAAQLADRWLVIEGDGPDGAPLPGFVVRVVSASEATDGTLVTWDPRRPAPAEYRAEQCRIRGNVVPAHHGVPLSAEPPDAGAPDPLAAWRGAMRITLPETTGRLRDVTLPASPISRPGLGWPLPRAPGQINPPALAAWLDGMAVPFTDDLSDDLGAVPLMALRHDSEGFPALAVANAADGGELTLEMSVGLGAVGNVGQHALSRILLFGPDPGFDALLADRADRLETLLGAIAVTNPLRAVGGRDPDGMETIRAQAPLANRRALSAVAPDDYARLLESLGTVNAARASVVDRGLSQTIRVTALMADEDTLTQPEMGAAREAERLRRWAVARRALDEMRLMGFDTELVPPDFVPLDIDLSVELAPWAIADQTRRAIEDALQGDGGLFDPDNRGLGRDVTPHAIHQTVLGVAGVTSARLLRLRRLAPDATDYADAAQMPVGDTEVAILKRPYGVPDGVLSITTCGGVA